MEGQGLDVGSTPFYREVSQVTNNGKLSPCYHFDLELHVEGTNLQPIAITSVEVIRDFLNHFYPVNTVTFKVMASQREWLIANMDRITATFKSYQLGRTMPFSYANLRNPTIRKYKAKLYLAESDYITQNNFAVNNADYMNMKAVVDVKVQLVEEGFESLNSCYVGGTYRDITGSDLIRHLIATHSNTDNTDSNTLIHGVDIAPNASTETRDHIVIKDGTSLVQAMHVVNENSGGLYAAGFSYFIYNNIWYVFPPYSVKRFNENNTKLVIVNLPKNRLPGIEVTYNDSSNTIIVLSTKDAIVKDKRESKKIDIGTGTRFADASRLMDVWAKPVDNKLNLNASQNVNDLLVDERSDNVNYLRFSSTGLTSAKNIELSKLAPAQGFMMRLSWENSDESLVQPGMPVKVLYLKDNQTKSAIGTVVGIMTSYAPQEAAFPAMKFSVMSYIDVFVSDSIDDLNT